MFEPRTLVLSYPFVHAVLSKLFMLKPCSATFGATVVCSTSGAVPFAVPFATLYVRCTTVTFVSGASYACTVRVA